MKPAAATVIQQAYRRACQERQTRASHAQRTIVKSWRNHLTKKRVRSAIIMQAAVRRHLAAKQRADILARLTPMVLCIQGCVRGMLARRQLRDALAAACSIQASWRMARSKVVGCRLAGATARLQAGAVLAKYRQKGGLSHERHAKFVWLSKDRQKLCWTDPAAKDARSSEADKSVSMKAVTAVSSGVKTSLMKKVEKAPWTRPLDGACAFSLIGSDRVLDLVAPDRASQEHWLRDLRTILVYGHHLDHKVAVGAIEAGMRRGSLAEPVAAAA